MEIGWRKAVDAIIESGRQYETALAVIAAAGKDKLREVLEKMEENT